MQKRISIYFLFNLFLASCSFYSSEKKESVSESVINFNEIDVSPSFEYCDRLIDQEKTKCFRKLIHHKINKALLSCDFVCKHTFTEKVLVKIMISNKGRVSLLEVIASDHLTHELPQFTISVERVIEGLPVLSPAIKRGIPVTVQYTIPVIVTSE